ncbi:hypothetical protein Val02_59450 [Virgisporangium aliadipatigenens]|uniref:Uncharacterized protein n=1 Tax=Virgisporangium aliadipatigenens TaxID=741659 RepID=A0A8J4DST5_9ACTN|nr:hypothetical protein [Virgisporangium aliadipatigenens]GIJ49059.1 hypothetical protein Val02_59450 [Virgisporangium aliadipatigenens]
MSYDLRDVLDIAKEGAPPARNRVDDIVASGRRLEKRRRAAWLTGTAAVVALVAAGAVTVPVFVGGGGGGQDSAAPNDGPVTIPVPGAPFDTTVAASTAGKYKITDPLLVNDKLQRSNVYRDGARKASVQDQDGKVREYDFAVGTVTVYRPGAFDPKEYAGGTAVTVRTRPGLIVDRETSVNAAPARAGEKPGAPKSELFPSLAWQYADGAWATIVVNETFGHEAPREDLVAIAAGVAPSASTPVKVPFSLGYKPAGWTLADAGLGGAGAFQETLGELRFLGAPTQDPEGGVRLTVYEGIAKYNSAGKQTTCDGARPSICDRDLGNGWFVEIVDGYGTMSETELRRVVDGVVPAASFTDRAGWTAAAAL